MTPLVLRSDHHELRRLRSWLASWIDDADELARIELCVHETAANVVDHASATGLTIEGRVTGDTVHVELVDDGRPYVERRQNEHPRVRGYGQIIAQQLASDIRYERIDGRNRWLLRFGPDDQSSSAWTIRDNNASSPPVAAETASMALRMNRKSHAPDIITVSGRLDSIEAAPLRSSINEKLTNGNSRIVVDLSEVEFLDSAGLAALVIGMKRARLEHGDVRLVTPRRAEARRVFELTKFDEVFVMADTLEEVTTEWQHD